MDANDPLIGTTLKGKWRIDALLGVGGMASVYAATHRNGKRVAIKMLRPELSAEPTMRTRFLREGYAANTVGHRGTVIVDDDDITDDGVAFLVMELLEGESLEERRRRSGGVLPVEDVLAIADQLLDTLAAAHDKGIVHRDLKPENLFWTSEGALKILDFGIARLREGGDGSTGTRVGLIMGTPAFMAPEQARGRWDLVDGRTDLWAVGATLFVLLGGRYVREAGTTNEELALAITTPAPPIATVVPDLDARIAACIDRALAHEKEQRWPDARAMQHALREARETPSHDAANVSERAPRSNEPRSASKIASAGTIAPGTIPSRATIDVGGRRPWVGATAVVGVGVLLVGLGAWVSRARSLPTPASPAADSVASVASPTLTGAAPPSPTPTVVPVATIALTPTTTSVSANDLPDAPAPTASASVKPRVSAPPPRPARPAAPADPFSARR